MKSLIIFVLCLSFASFCFGQTISCKDITITTTQYSGDVATVQVTRTNTDHQINGPAAATHRLVDLTGGECVDCPNLKSGVKSVTWKIKKTSNNAKLAFTSLWAECSGTSMNLSPTMTCKDITVKVSRYDGDVVTVQVTRTNTDHQINGPAAATHRLIDLAGGECIDCKNLMPGTKNVAWKIRNTSSNAKLTFTSLWKECTGKSIKL